MRRRKDAVALVLSPHPPPLQQHLCMQEISFRGIIASDMNIKIRVFTQLVFDLRLSCVGVTFRGFMAASHIIRSISRCADQTTNLIETLLSKKGSSPMFFCPLYTFGYGLFYCTIMSIIISSSHSRAGIRISTGAH